MFSVRESFKHGSGVKIPDVRSTHHPQPKRPKKSKVNGGVHLLHEACDFTFTPNSTPESPGTNQSLHQELTREGKENGVECDKGKVLFPFTIHHWTPSVFWRLGIGEEDGVVQGIRLGRVDSVRGEQEEQQYERDQPCVSQGKHLQLPEYGFGFSSF